MGPEGRVRGQPQEFPPERERPSRVDEREGRRNRQSDHDPRERDLVRQDAEIEIDERADDQGGKEPGVDGERRRPLPARPGGVDLLPGRHEKKRRGQELHQGVTGRDRQAAAAAPPPEDDPAQDRQVVVPGDGAEALGAPRPGAHDGHAVPRQPEDTDVEERPDDRPRKRREDQEDGTLALGHGPLLTTRDARRSITRASWRRRSGRASCGSP